MIDLGLARISRLLSRLGNPQDAFSAFHVAGTNGKGSVCTYIESVLSANSVATGKFTSPHLISPNDAIRVRQADLDRAEYDGLLRDVRDLSDKHGIGATEFEIHTAVAFQAFRNHRVEVAAVEVGLGGAEDATNALPTTSILCSAITKIAVDHEKFLGSTPEEVAVHKAGIMRPGKPCVVDGSNSSSVLSVLREHADRVGASLVATPAIDSNYREQNLAVALEAVRAVYPQLDRSTIEAGVQSARWPGRLQWVSESVLVDGAHNQSAAVELRRFVDSVRKPVRWVVAFSKPAAEILGVLVRPEDHVVATTFGAVEGMPWITAQPTDTVAAIARQYSQHDVTTLESVQQLDTDFHGLTVVCGSLYLVGEYLNGVIKEG